MFTDAQSYIIAQARSSSLVSDLIDLIGLNDTLSLLRARGGERVYIPLEVTDGHWLLESVGKRSAETVCRYWGGDYLALPMGSKLKSAQRNVEIYRAREQGKSVKEIARLFETTERSVRMVLAKLGKPCAENPLPARGKRFDPWKRKARKPKREKVVRDTDKQIDFDF